MPKYSLIDGFRARFGRLSAWARGFPPSIWLLTGATMVESTGRFMVVPYLSLYLNDSGVGLGIIGIILGAAPIASLLFGALGGQLSDRWGRKPVQIIGVATSGLALIGFSLAGANPYLLGLLNFLNGMTRTFYRPATSAAIADLCPPERRSEAYALNKVALNAAFGYAPLLGVLLFQTAPRLGFALGGILNLAVGAFLAFAVPESAPAALERQGRRRALAALAASREGGSAPRPEAGAGSASEGRPSGGGMGAWLGVFRDRGFMLWLLGLATIWGAYDLLQSFLPIHLRARGLPLGLYGALLTTNALVCTIGQIPISRAYRRAAIGPVAAFSKALFVLGFLGFAWLSSPLLLVLAMFVLSVGEIIGSAVQVRFVPERAPPELLGRYMGLAVAQDLGKVFAAPAAGFLMEAAGGASVFVGAALLSVLGAAMLYVSNRLPLPRASEPRGSEAVPAGPEPAGLPAAGPPEPAAEPLAREA